MKGNIINMRIISGKARGTKLYTLDGTATRPTLDRVKESVFNIIQNRIPESTVLDLFSGSGAIGLEFASRGARKVLMCDKSKRAKAIIEANIEKTHLKDNVYFYNLDYKELLKKVQKEKFDIIYLDPPYKTNFIKDSIIDILKYNCLKENGLIIFETDEEERVLNEIKDLNIEVIDNRKYGRAYIVFLKEKIMT